MTKQDVVHALTIGVLVWMGIQEKVHALVSDHTFNIVMIVFGALALFVYYADVLFKGGDIQPPAPKA